MGKKESLKEYAIRTGKTYLLDEWDTKKNGNLRPDDINKSNKIKKIWWKCQKGHEWQATASLRLYKESYCPYCSGRYAIPGENDLQTRFPELAKEWHPTLNGELKPNQVAYASNKKVWWLCPKGHSYDSTPHHRTKEGKGCPYCSGQKVLEGFNDLATLHPDIAKEWHPTLNGELKPTQVTVSSSKKVWWLCPLGHSYKSSIFSRTRPSKRKVGCPYCANRKVLKGFNDLATKVPEVAKQWHPTLNGDLLPEHVTPGSGKKVWWICAYGHVWQASIHDRAGKRKTGCPVCAGNIKNPKMQILS